MKPSVRIGRQVVLAGLCLLLVCSRVDAQSYDGRWWKKVSEDRQSGYLEGYGDCMTWTLHRSGFNGTSQQMRDPITKFYASHPGDRSEAVSEVWGQLWVRQNPSLKTDKNNGGEDWGNPHWYLDGYWWKEATNDERLGFIEGHLSCIRQNPDRSQGVRFPRSYGFYVAKISAYYNNSPKRTRKPVADVLYTLCCF